MTTRRSLLLLAGGVVAATAGCRARTVADVPDVPDVLVADSRKGLVVLGRGRRYRLGTAAAVSPDGALAYAVTRDDAGRSALVRLRAADVAPVRSIPLGGGWVPRAVSPDGRACALGRQRVGGAQTSLLVVVDGEQRQYDLTGVIEPDAFTADCGDLFVLEWLPPEAPDRYRVRMLNLTSGRLEPLFTRDKTAIPPGAEEEMRGEGRQAVLSPDGLVLYTLYTHQPGHRHTRDLIAGRPGGAHAFVHVLHLRERWAYCLDLPHPFGEGPAAGHAVAADGRRLAVVDVTSGSLALADPVSLTVSRVVPVPAGGAHASLALGRHVYAAAGSTVTVLDDAGAVAGRWSIPGTIRGLGVSRDRARVYAGGADEVVWLDGETGAVRGRAAVDGLTTLLHVRPPAAT
jgi:DNA-binding beta-propeller fold protein YncE